MATGGLGMMRGWAWNNICKGRFQAYVMGLNANRAYEMDGYLHACISEALGFL